MLLPTCTILQISRKRSSFSERSKILNLIAGYGQRWLYPKLYLTQHIDPLKIMHSCEVHGLSIDQGLTLAPMNNYQVLLSL